MTFKVEFTPGADADLDRLFDFLLERAETVACPNQVGRD